jgi:hypothetical protein
MITILTKRNLKHEHFNRNIKDIGANMFNIDIKIMYSSDLLIYTDKDLFKIFKSRYSHMYNNTHVYEYRLLSTIIDIHLKDENTIDINEKTRIHALRTLSRYDDKSIEPAENKEKAVYGQLVKSIGGIPSIAINETHCVQQTLRIDIEAYTVELIDYNLSWNNTYNLPLPSEEDVRKSADVYESNKLKLYDI